MSVDRGTFGEGRLAAVLAAYREACPDPEPGPGFTPGLWDKIEARRAFAFALRRTAHCVVTAAVALCILMAILLVVPGSQTSLVYSASYLEVLADDRGPDQMAYADFDGRY